MVLLSLNKLEMDFTTEKQVIMSKIISFQKPKKISYGKLAELINNTIHNLKLVDEFVKLFDKYVTNTLKYNKKINIHNNNFENTILNKKNTILLEYNKYCDKFIKLIDYFKLCSESIIQQINTSDFLKFFLTEKTI